MRADTYPSFQSYKDMTACNGHLYALSDRIEPAETVRGPYFAVKVLNKRCLDVRPNGDTYWNQHCSGETNQQWYFQDGLLRDREGRSDLIRADDKAKYMLYDLDHSKMWWPETYQAKKDTVGLMNARGEVVSGEQRNLYGNVDNRVPPPTDRWWEVSTRQLEEGAFYNEGFCFSRPNLRNPVTSKSGRPYDGCPNYLRKSGGTCYGCNDNEHVEGGLCFQNPPEGFPVTKTIWGMGQYKVQCNGDFPYQYNGDMCYKLPQENGPLSYPEIGNCSGGYVKVALTCWKHAKPLMEVGQCPPGWRQIESQCYPPNPGRIPRDQYMVDTIPRQTEKGNECVMGDIVNPLSDAIMSDYNEASKLRWNKKDDEITI